MRTSIHILLILLCLSNSTWAQGVLDKRVTLQYKQITIAQAIRSIELKYGVRISYSNNLVPSKKVVHVNLRNVMLKDVLKEILADTDVTYQLVGNQIVLKKAAVKKSTSTKKSTAIKSVIQEHPLSDVPHVDTLTPAQVESVRADSVGLDDPIESVETSVLANEGEQVEKQVLKDRYRKQMRALKAEIRALKDSLRRGEMVQKLDMKFNYLNQKLKQEYRSVRYKKSNVTTDSTSKNQLSDSLSSTMVSDNEIFEDTMPISYYQVTFIPPIGTHGVHSHRYANIVSYNVLMGNNGGVRGAEFGGISNVVHKDVYGAQCAGVANIVGGSMKGAQCAGVINIVADSSSGLQGAGFCNINKGGFYGLQGAGFCNIQKGSFKGLQGAGFCNVNNGPFYGGQGAGFCNIQKGKMYGVQMSGFLNKADTITGAQFSFINISDTITGVPVGFFSYSKKGYHRLELSGSEVMYANMAFKTGVKQFYNIFYAGYQWGEAGAYRTAFGYGVGSGISLSKRTSLFLDLISMHVNENETFTNTLNLLNKASFTLDYRLGKSFSLFAGPTFNATISQYKPKGASSVGSELGPSYAFYEHTDNAPKDPVNYKMWIGFQGGIRF